MFEFVPNNLSSREAFPIIDEFYDGWFKSQNISFDDVLEYYPGADSWDRATLFTGLLWMYYNYPIDYLARKDDRVPGAKLYRKTNFWRVVCFLIQSSMNESVTLSIIDALIDSNLKGKYPAAKSKEAMQVGEAIESGGFPNAEEAVIIKTKEINHPFARKTKAGKVPLAGLKKRVKKGVIFTQKAIDTDKELIPILNFEFMKLLTRRGERKGERMAARERQKESDLRREQERVMREKNRTGRLQRLLDQINVQNVSIEKTTVRDLPQYVEEPKLRHKVTNKRFVPFVFEEIDLDIDPNLIADKISELTASISSSSKSKSSNSKTKSKRSDFSTESFAFRDESSSVLSNWEDDASSIEI